MQLIPKDLSKAVVFSIPMEGGDEDAIVKQMVERCGWFEADAREHINNAIAAGAFERAQPEIKSVEHKPKVARYAPKDDEK
jgi:hypothetical protein